MQARHSKALGASTGCLLTGLLYVSFGSRWRPLGALIGHLRMILPDGCRDQLLDAIRTAEHMGQFGEGVHRVVSLGALYKLRLDQAGACMPLSRLCTSTTTAHLAGLLCRHGTVAHATFCMRWRPLAPHNWPAFAGCCKVLGFGSLAACGMRQPLSMQTNGIDGLCCSPWT
jgi:hypothetical protein